MQNGTSWEGFKLDTESDESFKEGDECLLSSVLADTEVKTRLEQLTADEKIVTICSLAGNQFTHPNWRHPWEDYSTTEIWKGQGSQFI